MSATTAFQVNGRAVGIAAPRQTRLADVLRDDLGLTGTKIGCNAGDCGACTVLLDGEQVCACMVSLAQAEGRDVTTVEGLADGELTALQNAFHRHGAAQCGICTPGMLMAASTLLASVKKPTGEQVQDALGGVLCRCTGYQKIVEAVLDVATTGAPVRPEAGHAVGARLAKIDGLPKLTGDENYGADAVPPDALWLRALRSLHAAARFEIGDIDGFVASHPGIERVLTAADVPFNGYGIYPDIKDQPVLAEGQARYRGEAVVALIGSREAIAALDLDDVPRQLHAGRAGHRSRRRHGRGCTAGPGGAR